MIDYLGPVVSDSFLGLLLKVAEVGRDVLQAFPPEVGVVSEKIGELINLSFVGGPLYNPGGFVVAGQVVWSGEVLLVFATVQEGQGGGPLDALVLGHGVELFLISSLHSVGLRVCSVVSWGSVSAHN